MTECISELRNAANIAEGAFIDACQRHGFRDQWDAYKSEQKGIAWPSSLADAHSTWMHHLHAFYTARDGAGGFLGSKGL